MLHIEDRQEKKLLKTASLADSYYLIHKSIRHSPRRAEANVKLVPESQEISDDSLPILFCNYCRKEVHTTKNCPEPRCKSSDIFRSKFFKPVVRTPDPKSTPISNIRPVSIVTTQNSRQSAQATTSTASETTSQSPEKPACHVTAVGPTNVFDDFTFNGHVSLEKGRNKIPIKILRDTASGVSLLHYSSIPGVAKNFTGEHENVLDLTGPSSAPLANIYLDCPIVKGKVKVGIRYKEFPVEGIGLLLGNDLAGNLVVPKTQKEIKAKKTGKRKNKKGSSSKVLSNSSTKKLPNNSTNVNHPKFLQSHNVNVKPEFLSGKM